MSNIIYIYGRGWTVKSSSRDGRGFGLGEALVLGLVKDSVKGLVKAQVTPVKDLVKTWLRLS